MSYIPWTMRVWTVCSLLIAGSLLTTATVQAEDELPVRDMSHVLKDYVAQADDSFQWRLRQTTRMGASDCYELTLTSQTWKNIVWHHRLFLIVPDNVTDDAEALLVVEGGRWEPRSLEPLAEDASPDYPRAALMIGAFAEQLGAPIAVLLNVPRQPILDGRREDQIIAYTFDQFLNTGDTDWLLLLPMVNSAVRAMDAIQSFASEDLSLEIDRFTVTGASKRGWTSWLTAAVDERVMATAPMVIDMLDMERQLEHQYASWGEFSNRIHDYTEINFHERIHTPRGRELQQIVDPFHYQDRIEQPKMVLLGTNDSFWTLDSLNIYWDAMQGEKYIVYVPNADHDLSMDFQRIMGGLRGLHHHALGKQSLPNLEWDFNTVDDTVVLTVNSDQKPTQVRLWSTSAKSKDFRKSRWTSQTVQANEDGQYVIRMEIPEEGYQAAYAELVYPRDRMPLHLATTIHIFGNDEDSEAGLAKTHKPQKPEPTSACCGS